jgi:hypothetical protein
MSSTIIPRCTLNEEKIQKELIIPAKVRNNAHPARGI